MWQKPRAFVNDRYRKQNHGSSKEVNASRSDYDLGYLNSIPTDTHAHNEIEPNFLVEHDQYSYELEEKCEPSNREEHVGNLLNDSV